MVLCLHEEHAVAIAHGYAKVTGRPMAAALHANVGLMHATMAIFNAWCDRVPMLILGATGPSTPPSAGRGSTGSTPPPTRARWCAPFVKWDDQPASAAAAVEALLAPTSSRGHYPSAPVYVCLDAALQEAELAPGLALPDLARHRAAGAARARARRRRGGRRDPRRAPSGR